jgi:hypothetical protein
MAKDGPSSILSPFQRFETLAKALFAVPKKEADRKTAEARSALGKRKVSKKRSG